MDPTHETRTVDSAAEKEDLGERIRELERLLAEKPAASGAPGQPERRTTEGPKAAERPANLSELASELEAQRDQLRDYQKSLVERIADVDDDRRTTAATLQRAWETQREEIDQRLRRHTGLSLGALAIAILLIAGALFLAYREVPETPLSPAPTATQPRTEAETLSRIGAEDALIQAKLAELTRSVAEVSAALERLSQEQERTLEQALAATQGSGEDLATRLRASVAELQAEQQRLAGELDSLRQAEPAAEAPAQGSGPTLSPVAGAETGDTAPSPSPAPESVAEQAADEGAAAVAEPPPPAAPEGAARTDSASATEAAPAGHRTRVLDSDAYALQLIGFFSLDSLQDYVQRADLPAEVYVLQETYRGRPWFALIHSLHATRDAAVASVGQLPSDLAALEPWIRPLSQGLQLQVLEAGAGR